ncbi:hypothetical protein JKA73_36405 [Myxococcus xanthus]|uniref:hypothetical protein n=1 Tax=Myxococcus xanthus TaxID=34 RepID=UPI00191721A7|nr:hypothetical protein [Myxococcus xanthus]QQR44388.1 hypothetical protein JKA73_36405 [Myxococcus xanthus]
MKGIKFGGFKSPSIPKSPASSGSGTNKPSAPSPVESKPASKPNPVKDGFDAQGSKPSTSKVSPQPTRQPGKDVTSSFGANPLGYSGQNVLNAYNMFPGGAPQGVALPTAQKPFVNASDSVVTLNAHQHQGNTNLSVSPAGGQGIPAHYMHYLSTGEGKFAGIQGVPLHPRPGEPNTVVTGALNGCAVHALHDTKNNSLSFLHHADYSKNGKAELDGFLSQHPNLRPAGSFTPSDYSHPTGKHNDPTGATPFIHYSQGANNRPGQWTIAGQLNTFKNGGTEGGRPELMRPTDLQVPLMQTIPVDVP